MQTKVRLIKNVGEKGYDHFYLEILDSKYYVKPGCPDYLEIIGRISFQANKENPDYWYGMNFLCETDKPENLKKMAKIGEYIIENRDSSNDQPSKIFNLIGGVEYYFFESNFIPVSSKGQIYFHVCYCENGNTAKKGDVYTHIISPSLVLAKKKLSAMIKAEALPKGINFVLKEHKVIV